MAPADRRRVRLDDPAAGRVLQPAAVLRARPDGRGGEGLTSVRSVSANRRWAAIAIGTLYVVISFWSMAYGLAVANVGTPTDPDVDGTMIAAAGVGLAVLLIPFGLATVALVSRRTDWPLAVLAGMGLSLAIGLPLLIFRNPLASLIAGYAAAAVVTVSRPEETTWHNRAIAAAIVSVVTLLGMRVLFVPTAVVAPGLPFFAVGIADLFESRWR